ncbi:esterase FrsA [Edwardsiella tarda]|uniref:esterase FrsA n=1 Tax=Edwardsiella tarda TaxID=636 RepID=UPI000D50A185|nr:esterase FrsA [Edwardsiella tarda]UCQ17167.1 esterase FrsA [Edwardsiella tarda]
MSEINQTRANLSETLFKPRFKHRETSTLVNRASSEGGPGINNALDGRSQANWYRIINRVMWAWRGADPLEVEMVLARIAASDAERSDERLLDTVVGYRSGNWIYEWSHQAMTWQQRAQQESVAARAGDMWLQAANLYSIAAYPHLKGDDLAEQAEALANRAYAEAARLQSFELRELTFRIPDGKQITGFLHLPDAEGGPYPTVLLCGGLDMLQSDSHRLFRDYLVPAGMAMLTIDMPSVGLSSHYTLTQDSSRLHQAVLQQMVDLPWVDSTRISALGFRFGANVAVRLAYLEPRRLRAVACLGPVVHHLLCDANLHQRVPPMYIDVLASRLGMASVSDAALLTELRCYSLKTQGLLGRRCPTPMLAAYWDRDPFSPRQEAQLIANSSSDGALLPVAASPLYQGFDRALRQICEWINKHSS